MEDKLKKITYICDGCFKKFESITRLSLTVTANKNVFKNETCVFNEIRIDLCEECQDKDFGKILSSLEDINQCLQ